MKNGKEKRLNEIGLDLLDEVGGGAPASQFPPNTQVALTGSGNANTNGSYNYNVGVTLTINPTSLPNVSLTGGVAGNNNQAVEAVSGQIAVVW